MATFIRYCVLSFLFMAMLAAHRSEALWRPATATFYGDATGGETTSGACGYIDTFRQGYGVATTALSYALFKDGALCGACYQLRCVNDPKWCIKGAGTITVTATNFCPSTTGKYPWCNPPREHFDLTQPMFTKIAIYKAGIVPVQYRRVPCTRKGGIRFQLGGNPYWITAVVYNVAGDGVVTDVLIKGSAGAWTRMSRNWGQVWQTSAGLVGQGLSFRVTTSNRKQLLLYNVAPSNWKFGQAFDGKKNFKAGR